MNISPILKEAIDQYTAFRTSQRYYTLAFFIFLHIAIFQFVFPLYITPNADMELYFNAASKLANGLLPYQDFNFEYPPFSLIFFVVPALITKSYSVYAPLFQYEVLVFDIVGLLLVFDIARRLGEPSWKSLLAYTLSIVAVGPIVIQTFDIFPAILTLAAIYLFWLEKHNASWALLALGTLTKIYPAVVAPIFLLIYLRNRQFKRMRNGLLVFCSVCLITVVPLVIWGSDSILNFINYHSQRGIQIESTYSALIIILYKMGVTSVRTEFTFGSWNIVNPMTAAIAKLSLYLTAVSLLIAYWFIYRQVQPGQSQFTRIGVYVLLVLAITMATSKVLSPQYLIWLIPLFPIVCSRWRAPIVAAFIIAGALTYYIYPWDYSGLLDFHVDTVAVLLGRNVLLILLAVLAAFSLKRTKPFEPANI